MFCKSIRLEIVPLTSKLMNSLEDVFTFDFKPKRFKEMSQLAIALIT